jgi:hypothetical protein
MSDAMASVFETSVVLVTAAITERSVVTSSVLWLKVSV